MTGARNISDLRDGGSNRESLEMLLARALESHRQGKKDAARRGYELVLGRDPDHVDALNLLGVLEQEAGRLTEALTCLKKAAGLDADNEIVLNNLGNALKADGDAKGAESCYRRAAAVNPTDSGPPYNLAALLQSQGRLDEAVRWYRRTLELSPDDSGSLNNLAVIYQTRGETELAETIYRRVLEVSSDHPRALVNLAGLLLTRQDHDQAIQLCRRALALIPQYLEALLCLGRACRESGRLDEARRACELAVTHHPRSVEAIFNLGNVLKDQGQYDPAAECYQRALALDPEFAKAWCNLGSIRRQQGQNTEAEACYRKAISLDSGFAAAYNNLSLVLSENGRVGEALACCRTAQRLKPDFAESYNNMARCFKYSGRVEESIPWYRKSLAVAPETAFVRSNLLYALAYVEPEICPAREVAREHREWEQHHGAPKEKVFLHYPNLPDPGRPLRVGYLSPDFRKHPVAVFMEPILAGHDRSAVEAICFSDVGKGDCVSARLKQLAAGWVDTAGLSDDRVAEIIRKTGIDILVDLAGHTAGNRMPLFSRRPAPVQVTYLGYPNTTGLSAMDYRITDAWADPPGLTEPYHSETLVRLPQGFLCYSPPEQAPPVMPPPFERQGHITFGSFNNLAKFNASVADLWGKILHAVPGSTLVMKFKTLGDPEVQNHIRSLFADRGIDPARIECLGFLPSARDHFGLYNRIDIALDTFPYNGTTTTFEALWMGVPVIALEGDAHAARVGVSILTGIGLDALIGRDKAAYVQKAVTLARDPDRLNVLRSALRPKLSSSPMTDGPGFARHLEAAYRRMWQGWCDSQQGAGT